MSTLRIHALALALALTACDRLADDSDTGKVLAHLSGTVSGPMPDDPVRLATLWTIASSSGDECAPWEFEAKNAAVIQDVDGYLIDGSEFEVELDAAPPVEAFFPGLNQDGYQDSEHPERSLPFDHATGVLVAYADRNDNGRLDPCDDSNCADRVLGTSNPDGYFLTFLTSGDPVANTDLGIDEYFALPEAFAGTPTSLLFTTEAWKPYGTREIPPGYVVVRDEADVASGERFLDGFDPDMRIEIPLVASPVLDQLSCDGGCVSSFVHGEAECPDQETGWCSVTPEMPPTGAEFRGVQCRTIYRDGNPVGESCNPVWSTVTWGCARSAELWLGCPVAGPDSPPDLEWSCLD